MSTEQALARAGSTPSATARRRARYPWFVARRLLWARRRGFLSLISAISALGFMLGVASLVVVLALMTGFQDDVIEKILGANAHLIVYPSGGGGRIEDPDAMARRLAALEGVVAVAPRVYGYALLSGPTGRSDGAAVFGVDPAATRAVTDVADTMVAGRFEALAQPTPSGFPGVVVGKTMADRQHLMPGDLVRMVFPVERMTPWGTPTARTLRFEVVGVFESGFFEYDATWTFIPLEKAQAIYGLGDAVHWMAIRVDDAGAIERRRDEILAALGEGWVADDVLSQNRSFFSALRLEKLMMFLAVGLIVGVAALGVVSTLVLTVAQRRRQIGVLVSLGATPSGVLAIFVIQGLAMGLLGTGTGAVFALGLCWWLDAYQVVPLDPEVYYLSHLPFHPRATDVLTVVASAVVVAFLATLVPAWRASRLDPVEALRNE